MGNAPEQQAQVTPRDHAVFMAKLAERAERYQGMCVISSFTCLRDGRIHQTSCRLQQNPDRGGTKLVVRGIQERGGTETGLLAHHLHDRTQGGGETGK